ncbi:uncharacterized protein F4822DRAFT_168815 [Hypoxylon trugodes]|uniref:uncharacterized protein n=1 Tax=Hypoxylon trugodes TaxID=326681 RepID=UPI00219DBF1A|nr:uncharacterized protein F4822DRAFT_168815 [Hypoxylon trugodes]KAI1390986.1 hypothetical protein F4822DRAFT_168815 [Hypoxylon trugodes]
MLHGKRFRVSLLPPSSPDTIEGPLIPRFDSIPHEDEERSFAIQREIELLVYEAGGPIWTRLAPPTPNEPEPSDLHSHLYPETFAFRFVTKDGKAELIPDQIEGEPDHHHPSGKRIVDDIGLPQYSSKDIRVLEIITGQGDITKVWVGGTEMCCKSGEEAFFKGIEREFDCLRTVARSHLADSIRVPKLLGLVTLAETEEIIGILEEYIPTGNPYTLGHLEDKEGSQDGAEDEGMEDKEIEASTERRKKWGAQVRETVDSLHEIGVIWGDGKPHNVLIHQETDDAWVVDFGGGYTRNWVDEELMESLQGDEQAVGKILEFLGAQ